MRTVCVVLMAVSERMLEFHSDITTNSIYEHTLVLEVEQIICLDEAGTMIS